MKIFSTLAAFLPCVIGSASCEAFDVQHMTLEEKIGQLFIVCFAGSDVNEDAVTFVQDMKVGGILYYTWANDLSSAEQVKNLSDRLQKMAKIPLFIMADEEGGIVKRLQGSDFTNFPGNKALGMTGDPKLAKKSALAIGLEMMAAGVNTNLAPVIDINNNPRNPIIGVRSFGEDPQTVTLFGREALAGYYEAGVVTCVKHFPGHGDVTVDSHEDLPVLHKTKEELLALELVPFMQLSSKADMVMTAHLKVPTIDPVHPATFSRPILEILRKEIGFDKVVVADSLVMEGALKSAGSLEAAAIQALQAGCDLLLFGGKKLVGNIDQAPSVQEVKSVARAVMQAVEKGELSRASIDLSASRVLDLKKKKLLQNKVERAFSRSAHQELALEIAQKAVRVTSHTPLPASYKRIAIVAPSLAQSVVNKWVEGPLTKTCDLAFFQPLSPSIEEQDRAQKIAIEADVVVFFSYNAWKIPGQQKLLEVLSAQGKPFILVAMRDSLDTTLCPSASQVIETFGPGASSMEAATSILRGMLPVKDL